MRERRITAKDITDRLRDPQTAVAMIGCTNCKWSNEVLLDIGGLSYEQAKTELWNRSANEFNGHSCFGTEDMETLVGNQLWELEWIA